MATVYYDQTFDPFRVIVSYFISALAAYAATEILDHDRWRHVPAMQQLELHSPSTSRFRIRAPFWFASIAVGGGSIWCMHFLGMSALTLTNPVTGEMAEMRFTAGLTVFSCVIAVLCMRAGFQIMQRDCFAGPDRSDVLRVMLHAKITSIEKTRSAQGKRLVIFTAFFSKIHYLVLGSLVAAVGVVVMHYTGMEAMYGDFDIEWNSGVVTASIIDAVVVAAAGYFILFRLLVWKASLEWLRPACGAVIGIAVCSMHYLGMAAATYRVVSRSGDWPAGSFEVTSNAVLALVIVVLTLVFVTERGIAMELKEAYAKLTDTNLMALIYDSNSRQKGGGSGPSSKRGSKSPKSDLNSTGPLSSRAAILSAGTRNSNHTFTEHADECIRAATAPTAAAGSGHTPRGEQQV